jgi:polysaccharide biosynthesis protein PslK
MFGPTALLTIATIAGLCAGFAREWLLVACWGAGRQTDAFLVAMFLPEAIRTMLAGGLLSAACLPLWQETPETQRQGWLAGQFRQWLMVGTGLALVLALLSPWLVRMIGPGLAAESSQQAGRALACLAMAIPCLLLHAVLTVPFQARERFLLPGLGSLLFNLPVVVYLRWAGPKADGVHAALALVSGSFLMLMVLLPGVWSQGWRPWSSSMGVDSRTFWKRLWPLLASSGTSQGLVLVERFAASLLGEGTITMLNLARKLVSIPLIALMSLNQVILGRMSTEDGASRRSTLSKGLLLCTVLTLPAAAGIIASAPVLVAWTLPAGLSQGPLPSLLGIFAISLILGSWNAMLARYYYAAGDTRTPLSCELTGSILQAVCLVGLSRLLGIWGMAGAVMIGTLLTGILLSKKIDRLLVRRLSSLGGGSLLCCAFAALLLHLGSGLAPAMRFALAATYGSVLLAVMGWRFLKFEG